ncbi:uncharacterized protein L203_104707 [Cryptococcus depauperatus CBS 7841]|uniref:DUF7721 domain-containing protein n=1 Tax=Cryptococcus depauperatus CBS 7841 TaxID=1295531 RepID=A0AAJ8JVZ4_9TREE
MDYIKKVASEQFDQTFNGNQNHQQQGGNSYGQDNSNFGQTGGAEFNRPHGQGGAVGNPGVPNINTDAAVHAANQHNSNGSENSSLFNQAMSFIGNMNKNDTHIDEDKVQRDHQQAYGSGNVAGMTSSSLGAAAAMQALKSFTSGSSGAAHQSGGGDMQSKIIGMAMSEAAKLFDQSGGNVQGNKQDAVTSAGQVVMKMLIKNQVSGMIGGSNSGGLSSLMGVASKFLK